MTILEVVSTVEQLNVEAVVYSSDILEAWEPNSPCVLITDKDVFRTVIEHDGQTLHYFLGVELIREVIEGWREISPLGLGTPEEIARVVIYYAQYDSWPPPTDPLE